MSKLCSKAHPDNFKIMERSMRKRSARSVSRLMLGVALSLTGTNLAFAYESVPVTNGGEVQGEVRLKGTPPPLKAFSLWRCAEKGFCAASLDQKGDWLFDSG